MRWLPRKTLTRIEAAAAKSGLKKIWLKERRMLAVDRSLRRFRMDARMLLRNMPAIKALKPY